MEMDTKTATGTKIKADIDSDVDALKNAAIGIAFGAGVVLAMMRRN